MVIEKEWKVKRADWTLIVLRGIQALRGAGGPAGCVSV